LVLTKPDDGHEWPKHVVLILILAFKYICPLYHTICVTDYSPTYINFIVSYKEAWNLYVWRFSAYPFQFLPSRSAVDKASCISINYPSLCVDNLRIKIL